MRDDVRASVDARVNYFNSYATIPDDMVEEVSSFIRRTIALGNECADAADFEQRFAASSLSDEFNDLVMRTVPASTAAPQGGLRGMVASMGEMREEDRREFGRAVAADAVDTVATEAGRKAMRGVREQMLEDGVFEELSDVHDAAITAEWAAGLLGGLFGRKKKK